MGNSFQRILFPTDFSSTSESALKQAIAIAERYEAELHILTVVDHTLYSYARYPRESLREELVRAAEHRLKTMELPNAGLKLKTVRLVLEGDISEQVAAYARDYEIDMIVMASHARSKVARFFMGSVADKVLHLAGCPALVMRAPEGTARHPVPADRSFNTVIAPTDFSTPAEVGLQRAIHFARDYRAKLKVIHVIDDRKLLVLDEDKRKNALREIRDEVTQELDQIVANAGKGVDIEAEVLVGETTERIGHYAGKHNADLIVIGARASDEFKRLLVGSVADSLARIVDCPIFVEHVVDEKQGSGISTARIEAAMGLRPKPKRGGKAVRKKKKEKRRTSKKQKGATKTRRKTKSRTKTLTKKQK